MRTRDITLCALLTALTAVGAFIRIPIPVIPFTLQTLFVLLAGMLLGKKLGAVSMAVYVVLGLVGLPIFTAGGGLGYVFKPTFGYLLGFILGAFVTGLIIEKSPVPGVRIHMLAGVAGLAAVYVPGLIYYYLLANYYLGTPIGVGVLLLRGLLTTLPGDIALCVLASISSVRIRSALRAPNKPA